MLHNPNWDKTANDVSLDDFIAWLESKDPNESYNYLDRCGKCCIGQYMAARNIAWPIVGWTPVYKQVCDKVFGGWSFPQTYDILRGPHPGWQQNFGAVLQRTKAYKEKCYA